MQHMKHRGKMRQTPRITVRRAQQRLPILVCLPATVMLAWVITWVTAVVEVTGVEVIAIEPI